MKQISQDELIGVMESAYDADQQASALKGQAKEITDKKKEDLNSFAADCEVDTKIINKAYARYKELRNKTIDADDEDYYSIISLVEESFAEEEN